ncbi:MAG: GH116 family glycosyl hydrolase [Thermoguttaceae bacterium]
MNRIARTLVVAAALVMANNVHAEHTYSGPYTDTNLNRVAFPIGGVGSGMYCLEGTGAISHMSVHHRMEFFHEPVAFAAISVKEGNDSNVVNNVARVVEGPVPDWKYFGRPNAGNGAPGTTYGLPRFTDCTFDSAFPFATISLKDDALPITATITGFSPFVAGDADASSLPAGSLDYTFTNTSTKPVEAVFSFHARNFMGGDKIEAISGGFKVVGPGGAFAIIAQEVSENNKNSANVAVDHCWYRGGWWDALTIVWNNIVTAKVITNPPVAGNAAGASLYVPLKLAAGESKTVRLLTCWYVPESNIAIGKSAESGPAFREVPSRGATAGQNKVSGFRGRGLVNTYDPAGDDQQGSLVSPEFTVEHDWLYFLVGGGQTHDVGVALVVDGKRKQVARGNDSETLNGTSFDLRQFAGKKATVEIFDHATGPWGHINADHFFLSNQGDPQKAADDADAKILADFEGDNYGDWKFVAAPKSTAEETDEACCPPGASCEPAPKNYTPWYSRRFKNVEEVVENFTSNYDTLRKRSTAFQKAMSDSTLPPEVMEAVEANLTILKSPTLLRQHDGRIWAWEGNSDESGCCAGSCTHVWNYAQAMCHVFPSLERSLRQTEFFDATLRDGRQAFRANLPVTPGGVAWDASDGQLGGIMKAHREWRISGDAEWLKAYWPHIKRSLEFCIKEWDPNETGLLEKSHHNTYDINYLGPEGHCGSFYLGALAAAAKMGRAVGDNDVSRYEAILAKGRTRMEKELFNGEYFIQTVPKPGKEGNPNGQSEYYKAVAREIDAQGPKYQYGTGCLSDGVLGLWMAKVCGIDDDLVDPEMVKSHLVAIHKYNLKHDLSAHANPQRPSYALGNDGGLLLCTWPRGDKPLLPFVYSDEVWTGIEYQVASHLMLVGEVEKGLDIVRVCRDRHSGVRRNPFNEYECGHWYARAMSSFALLQGMTGVRYDAVTRTLYVSPRIDSFRVPLFTETGIGVVTFQDGKATLDVREGIIPVAEIVVVQ